MQFSELWLRTFADPPLASEELAARLTMGGLEVEAIDPVAPPFSAVVVARVRAVTRHPNAEKLTVCEVEIGGGRSLSIVCGAPNVAPGVKVPCALEGALLPGDVKIATATMRGVASHGMLCSARELGLGDDHGGLLLLADDAPIGQSLRDYLTLDDHKFTIKLTPNRGDCLGVFGVAREVAALPGAPLKPPADTPVAATSGERLPVAIHARDLCGRFSGRVIRGLNARAPTPDWIKQRLERGGQRPISALVDISNYVLLELGRPSHVFDLDQVRGGLEVRWGRGSAGGCGEPVTLLNEQSIEVDHTFGVIADDGGVVALAGIMGGARTAVSLETRNIYLEAAFWWPQAIRGRSRRLNFTTDAAHRFERGTDFATTVADLERITRLIVDICGTPQTQIGPIDDQLLELPQRPPVRMRVARCRRILGIDLQEHEMAAAFSALALPFERDAAGDFVVTPPSYRFDLEIEEDLIEEVARLWGFARIPALPPLAPAAMRVRRECERSMHDLGGVLAALGYQELITFSFVPESWEQDFAGNSAPIRVLNPIASQHAVMRTTLVGSLVNALKFNLNRKAARARIFEIGRTYLRDPQRVDGPLTVAGLDQPYRIAGLAYGTAVDEQWGERKELVDFFDVKGDLEQLLAGIELRFEAAPHPALHPGRSARVLRRPRSDASKRESERQQIGWIGELHPRLCQVYELPHAPVVFEVDMTAVLEHALPRVAPVPRLPAVQRDLALWFKQTVRHQDVLDAVAALAASDPRLRPLIGFRLFDLYRGRAEDSSKVAGADANVLLNKGKSLAFRVVLQDTDRTLSDSDADAAMAALIAGLQERLGASLRQ